MTLVSTFFEGIFGTEHVRFRCLKKGQRNQDINGHYNDHAARLLNQYNAQGYECYFVVNSGGYKDEEITRFNAVFVDFDCGRDTEDNYYPLDVVATYKEQKLEQVSQFPLPPTFVVETRNGLHVYWLLDGGATLEQFTVCERRLIAHLDADPKVKNPARLLRVPGTYWCKDPENRHMTTIIQHNNMRYDIAAIIACFPEIDSEGDLGVTKSKKCTYSVTVMDTKHPTASPNSTTTNVSNITLIRRQDIEGLQARVIAQPVELSSHDEVYDYLKRQDLGQFLGKCGKINCVVHHDENPSAGIFIVRNTDYYYYQCQSSNCGFKGTIIQLTERLTGLTRVDALRFLRKVYRISFVESDWQKRQREILEEDKRLILSEEFRDIYTTVYTRMRNYTHELVILHEKAIRHVTTETFTDSNGYPVFYAAISWVADMCGVDKRRVADHIALLAYLGLIHKLSEDEIPEVMLKKAKAEARRKGKRRIAFYSIPPYDEETLSFSRLKAKEFKEKGLTMKGWGRELLLRTFGEAEADRVYPQEKGKPITELSHEVTMDMVRIIFSLITEKGWTTESEILEHVALRFKGQNQFKHNQIKRVLPELLDGYGLVKTTVTKEMKQRLGIQANGYPKVIIREDDMNGLDTGTNVEKENRAIPAESPTQNI